jgi:hypothetical protein
VAIPTVQAVGTPNSGTTSGVTYTLPTHQADDILLLFVECSTTAGVSAPSGGWADITNSPRAQGSNVTCLNIFWLRATGSGTTNPTTGAAANHQVGFTVVVRGAITTGNPWDFSPVGTGFGAQSTFSATGGTTTVADCLVMVGIVSNTDTATDEFTSAANASLSSFTEQEQVFVTDGNGGGVACYTGGKASAGATGSTTGNITTTNSYSALTFAIKPATSVTLSASGTIAVVSDLDDSVTMLAVSSGTITVVSTLVGNAQAKAVASGTIPVVSTLVGNAQARAVASGTIPIVSNLVGNATKVPPAAAGTIPVVSGQAGTVTARMVASGTIPVVSALQGTVTAREVASGTIVAVVTLIGDPTKVGAAQAVSGTITLVVTVSGNPTAPEPVVMLRLVLDRGRDEGGLPPDLWYHFSYPFTQTALLLFTDGRVIPTFTLEGPLYRSADAVAGGGYQSIYPSDSWEVDVLTDAGYTLEPVL